MDLVGIKFEGPCTLIYPDERLSALGPPPLNFDTNRPDSTSQMHRVGPNVL
jgi:hypothetical protein